MLLMLLADSFLMQLILIIIKVIVTSWLQPSGMELIFSLRFLHFLKSFCILWNGKNKCESCKVYRFV